MIGRALNGDYRMLDSIGSGGFASVYLARDLRTNEVVAVKVLHPQHAADPLLLERFQREAELARVLQHPNIVRMLDHGQDGDVFYLVMEYVQGHTIAQVLQRRGNLSVAE